jgi:hypothetical protein
LPATSLSEYPILGLTALGEQLIVTTKAEAITINLDKYIIKK